MKAKLLKPNLIALYLVLAFLGLTWLRFQRSEGQTNAFVSAYYSLSFDYPASWYAAEFPPGSPPPKSNKLYQIELRSGDGLVDSQAVVVRIYVRSHGGESLAEIVRQDPAGLEYQPSHLLSTQEAVIGQGDYPAIVQDYFTGDLAKVQLVYLIREDEVIIVDIWAVNSATFTESAGELAALLASLRLEATP